MAPRIRTATERPGKWLDKLGGLFLLHFINDGLQAALLMGLPLVAATLQMSHAECGTLTSMHFSLGIFLALPATWLLNRIPADRLLILGLAVCGLCFGLLGNVQHVANLWLVFLLAGIGFGSFHPIAFASLAQRTTTTTHATIAGWFTAAGDLGRVIISSTFLFAVTTCGWSTAARLFGLLTVFSVLGFVLHQRNHGGGSDVRDERTSTRQHARLCGSRTFALVTAVGFFDALANAGLVIFLPFVLLNSGLPSAMLPVATTVFFGSSVLGKVTMGYLADRLGRSRAIGLCQLANIMAVVSVVCSAEIAVQFCCVAILGATNKGCLPAILSLTSDSVSDRESHRAVGLNQLMLGIATSISPLVYGLFSHWVGDEKWVCLLAAAASAVAMVLAIVIHRTLQNGSTVEAWANYTSVCASSN